MPEDSGALALAIEHLDVTLRGRDSGPAEILRDVTLSARRGEILAVVGESGCGKSTLAAAIAGLLPRATARVAGRIVVSGHDVAQLPERELRKYRGRTIGFVPQDHMGAFNPVLTVERHLTEGPMTHLGLSRSQARRRAGELLTQVRLDASDRILKAYPHQLSGGMRQRVMIASAMACGPLLLVADEPTTALDVTVQAEILDLLQDICRSQGTALVLISHDLSVVAGVADSLAVLYAGEVVETGPARLVMAAPAHPYTEALLLAVPDPDDAQSRQRPLIAIGGRPPDVTSRPDGCWFHPRCPYSTGDDDCARIHPELADIGGGRQARTLHPRLARPGSGGTGDSAGQSQAAPRYTAVPGTSAAKALLQVEALTKTYGRQARLGRAAAAHIAALADVSIGVQPGQTFGLVGESGSGKSTLAHCILQLSRPYSGTITFDGRPLDELSGTDLRKLRRDFQAIFQDARNSLDARMTAGAAVEEALQIHEGRSANLHARALAALGQVGLGEAVAQRYPRQCSGGELQRICIARALILRPKLLICDEAVSSLDVSTRAQVLNLLRDIQAEEGIAILFITHDFGAVAAMSDVIGVLNHGHLVECGAASAVLHHPSDNYTRKLIDAVPRLSDAPRNAAPAPAK